MKTLVIGSEGFIGKHLSTVLHQRGEDLIKIDAMLPRVHGEGSPPASPGTLNFDIRDTPRLRATLEPMRQARIPELYFLASDTSTGSSLTEIDEHLAQNVLALASLLRVLADLEISIGRFILTSSRAVYGNGYFELPDGRIQPSPVRKLVDLQARIWDLPLPRGAKLVANSIHHPPHPVNIYGLSKKIQEDMLQIWAESSDCKVNIYRLQNVAGYGQSLTNPYSGVLTFLAQKAFEDEVLPIFEDGMIFRDFVSVHDVVQALISPLSDDHKIVDIGTGKKTSLLIAGEILVDTFGSGRVEIVNEFRFGDVRSAWADLEVTAKALPGWIASRTFSDIAVDLRSWLEVCSPKRKN